MKLFWKWIFGLWRRKFVEIELVRNLYYYYYLVLSSHGRWWRWWWGMRTWGWWWPPLPLPSRAFSSVLSSAVILKGMRGMRGTTPDATAQYLAHPPIHCTSHRPLPPSKDRWTASTLGPNWIKVNIGRALLLITFELDGGGIDKSTLGQFLIASIRPSSASLDEQAEKKVGCTRTGSGCIGKGGHPLLSVGFYVAQ